MEGHFYIINSKGHDPLGNITATVPYQDPISGIIVMGP